MAKLNGIPASPGIALGAVFLVDRRRAQVPRFHLDPSGVPRELGRLEVALKQSADQLGAIREGLGEGEQAAILEAHRMMAQDPSLHQSASGLIREELLNAEWAVRRSFREVTDKLSAASDLDGPPEPHLLERVHDLDEVCERILHNLMGETPSVLAGQPPLGSIVVAYDLPTADAAVLLNGGRVAGLATEVGSPTSHTAILARALEVPCVVGVVKLSEVAKGGDQMMLDGGTGEVVVAPDTEQIRRIEVLRQRARTRELELLKETHLPGRTRDGHTVRLLANIEFPEEVPSVLSHGGEGIGLYRTEFLYLDREELPTEEEHYQAYRAILEAMGGRPVTIRTLDLGGDKLPIGHRSHEANPALGLRAIRLTLRHPQLFRTQLRALWRASTCGNLRLLLPMVAVLSEVREAKALIYQVRDELVREGAKLAQTLPIGVMLETPAAALAADRLARECDFFSIGTNDLIQYALAVDRSNKDVAHLYRPLHLGVLRLIRACVEGARSAGLEITLCGEMAADPAYTLLLLALGIDVLSMSPSSIPRVKRVLRNAELRDARALLEAAMNFNSVDEIEKFVHAEMSRRFPELAE